MSCKFSDKPKGFYRRGLWSPEEDEKLKSYISRYGHGCWSSLPTKAGLQRNGKSCRLRWINYLRPGLKRGVFTDKEEETILTLQRSLGNKWSQMAQKLPGRTDNEIKNYWHSYLKRKAIEVEKIQSQSNTRSTASPSSQETTNEVSSFDAIPKFFSQDNNIPKVLFAEWFSPDHHVPCQNNLHPMNTSLYMGELSGDSVDVNNAYKQDSLDDLVGFVDGMHHEFNSGTTFGKLEQVEIVSKGEICDDFNMYSDLIYY